MPKEIEISTADALLWKYYFLVAVAIIFYEWLFTLDMEVERIWLAPRGPFTMLWVNVRYAPLVSFIIILVSLFGDWPETECRNFSVVPTVFLFIGFVLSHSVFVLRTYALYGKSRHVLYVLFPILGVETVVTIYGMTTEHMIINRTMPGCIPGTPQKAQGFLMWTAPFIFDSAVFVLTVRKSVEYFKSHDIPMVNLILRDGIVYYFVVLMSYLVNVVFFAALPDSIHDINAALSGVITMVVTARLVLNLRAVAAAPHTPVRSTGKLTPFSGLVDAFDGPLAGTEELLTWRVASAGTMDSTEDIPLEPLGASLGVLYTDE